MQLMPTSLALSMVLSVLPWSAPQAQPFTHDQLKQRTIERRAVEAAIWGMPLVNVDYMRQAYFRAGAQYNDVIFWSNPNTWMNQTTTPNHSTSYVMFFMNLKDGPVVVDIPEATEQALYGTLINAWNEPLLNVGNTGYDKGKGAKYVMLPPGYKGEAPTGYVPVQSSTFNAYSLLRVIIKTQAPDEVTKGLAYLHTLKVYPLARSAIPAPIRFIDVAAKPFEAVPDYDARFYTSLARMVEEETVQDRDLAIMGQLRSLGIGKGLTFNPDAASKKLLDAAAEEAHRSMMEGYATNGTPIWPNTDRRWTFLLDIPLAEGTHVTFVRPGEAMHVDVRAAAWFAMFGPVVPPPPQLYIKTYETDKGERLNGSNAYRLRVPTNVPTSQFWAVDVYDAATGAFIRESPVVGIDSYRQNLKKNPDGSVDIHFSAKAPAGQEGNWILTREGKPFFVMFRIYGPQKAAVDGSWKLNNIERIGEAAPSVALRPAAKDTTRVPYMARAFNSAHPDLPRSAGRPAQLANETYVEQLAHLVYYWAYPAIDVTSRTGMWELMRGGPGLMSGIGPGAPINESGCLAGYLPPNQRIVVTPNNDTYYGVSFVDLGREPVVIQTPAQVPQGHYWVMQIADVFTNVVHTLGSAWGTAGGKFLLVGPEWQGQKPDGFIDIIRLSTNYGGVFPRSFASRTPEARARAIAVQNQMGVYPLSKNESGRKTYDCEAISKNHIFPPGVTAAIIDADPDAARPQWVVPERFWQDLEKVLAANPKVGAGDAAMAENARTLVALYKSSPTWKALLDRAALSADALLHTSARYEQVGVDVGNGWQRQENGGLWGADWFGRAQAAVVYILVNDYHEAIYLIRGTDAQGALLNGKHRYTMTFPRDALPPVDRSKGGFWSLSMYDKDYFMLAKPANGRTNVGTVSLDANELKFASDGSLTIHMSAEPPTDPDARQNWLPAPDGQFALIVRAYVPTPPILENSYKLPNVERVTSSSIGRALQ